VSLMADMHSPWLKMVFDLLIPKLGLIVAVMGGWGMVAYERLLIAEGLSSFFVMMAGV